MQGLKVRFVRRLNALFGRRWIDPFSSAPTFEGWARPDGDQRRCDQARHHAASGVLPAAQCLAATRAARSEYDPRTGRMSVRIEDVDGSDGALLERLAVLSHAAGAGHASQWLLTLDDARVEVEDATAPGRITRVAFASDGEAVFTIRSPPSIRRTATCVCVRARGPWSRHGFMDGDLAL
jgi:hypothetical protein